MRWEIWIVFVITETAMCLTPGPAVMLVLSQALARGTLASIWSNVGILAGNSIYFILSATGLGAILLASYDLFSAIRWVGAAYLVYLGISAFIGKSPVLSVAKREAAPVRGPRILLNGLILQLANPKALVFFTALLPQFVDPTQGMMRQVAILALTSVSIEFCVLAGCGALAGRLTHLAARPRFAKLTNRLAGSMLITAGVGMASLKKA